MMDKRKKEIFAVLFVILLLLNISLAFAVDDEKAERPILTRGISGAIKQWFSSVKEGDTGIPIYDDHKTLIDFTIFFVIFLSLSMLSLPRFLGAGGKNAIIGLSLALSTALALAAIKAGMSVTFFIPFVKNAMFFIMFLLIFLLFKKLGMTSIFWNIIISVILTYLLFNVGNIILDKDRQLNLGNLFGIPTLSESLAQSKYELTKTNARFSALQEAINKNPIYTEEIKGTDDKIQYNELIRAREHYAQKLKEAEAAKKEADIKRYEEILEVVDDHIDRWEGYESEMRQGVALVNELAERSHATSDMLIPTAPILRLTGKLQDDGKWDLLCEVVKPSTLQDIELMPPGKKILYEFSWYKEDKLDKAPLKTTYKKEILREDIEIKTGKQTWKCAVRVTLLGYNNSAETTIVIGPGVTPADQTAAVLEQADARISEVEKKIEQAEAATKENNFNKTIRLSERALADLSQIGSDLEETEKDAAPEQKKEIDRKFDKIELLIKRVRDILSRAKPETAAGRQEKRRREEAAAAVAETAEQARTEAAKAKAAGQDIVADSKTAEAVAADGKALELKPEEDAEKAKPSEVKVIKVDVDKRPEPRADIGDIKKYLNYLIEAKESAR